MRILTNRIISIALVLCLCLAMLPAMTMQAEAEVGTPASALELANRMNNIVNGTYGIGKYFRDNQSQVCHFAGSSSRCHGNHDGDYATNDGYCNCKVATADIAGTTGGIQCFGYARYVFYQLFGLPIATYMTSTYWALGSTTNVSIVGQCSTTASASIVSDIFASARMGDFIQARTSTGGAHSMIVYTTSANNVTVLECNHDGPCYISTRTMSWSTFASTYPKFTVYTSLNHPGSTAGGAPDKPTITTTQAYYAEGSNISISWNAVSGNTYYWINVYKDGELIVNQSMGNETTYTLENATKGEYTFAVSANNSVGTSGGSSYSFLVGKAPAVPTITTTTTYYAVGTDVTINWSVVLGNTYYWVNVYKDEELIVNETAGNQTSFTFKVTEAGAYKFAVSANNGAGNKGSAKYVFLVGQPPEKLVLSEVQSNYDVGDSVTITWNPVVGNVYYWVTVYKDGEKFANQSLGNSTSYSISSAAEGQYTIYISANNGAGTSGSASCTFLVALSKYMIIYDANGGTNAPESQTKNHGEDLVLSNSAPTRNGFTFLGWETNPTATSATYQPGASITVNAHTILYAVWKQGCENDSHSYSYEATKAPTTSAAGTLTGTCSKCSGTTTVTLPKLNTTEYSYSVVNQPSSSATGTGRYTWNTTTYGAFSFDVTLDKIGLLGDVNGDGKVNMKDWNRVYEHLSEVSQLTGDALRCADVNGDGKVNMKDWNRLYEHLSETNPLW